MKKSGLICHKSYIYKTFKCISNNMIKICYKKYRFWLK